MNIILDLEYTGLDNSYEEKNEVIQVKLHNIDNGKYVCRNFKSTKPISAYGKLSHRCQFYEGDMFSKNCFEQMLKEIEALGDKYNYYGFGVDQDIIMLLKYGIDIDIKDIRTMLQLSEHEVRLATEGSGLEAAYLIVTGKYPELLNHDGLHELKLIVELYEIAITLPQKEFLSVMPHGHCAGMPLSQYVRNYRRAADGYRFHNTDILSASLENAIAVLEHWYDEQEDDDELGDDENDDLDDLPY